MNGSFASRTFDKDRLLINRDFQDDSHRLSQLGRGLAFIRFDLFDHRHGTKDGCGQLPLGQSHRLAALFHPFAKGK
jgi:hypothetical protein